MTGNSVAAATVRAVGGSTSREHTSGRKPL
jgi:hypothetical protein